MAETLVLPGRARILMKAHKPRGWKVVMGGAHQRGASGLCSFATKTIYVPVVCDSYSLLVYLHEVAHARLHARTTSPAHVYEYEAEMWAMAALRKCGFRVSREVLYGAKDNVGDEIIRDRVLGIPIDRKIQRWATRRTAGRCSALVARH